MNGKEIIRRVIEYNNPPRLGFDFNPPHEKDILWLPAVKLKNPAYEPHLSWGRYPEVKSLVPDFSGEVHRCVFGNIYGRLGHDSNGECIKGILQDDWALLDDYKLPEIDMEYDRELKARNLSKCDQFVLGTTPASAFSTLRDMRLMDHALEDILLEPEYVAKLLERVTALILDAAVLCAANGFDGMIMYDDWGMQHATFISPDAFRRLFKPVYKAVADYLHAHDMKLFVHSCGLVYAFMEDFIDAGVDVMQFDQPELSGSEVLAREFGGRMAFHCPTDIQKIMATGNRETIEKGALHMVESFKTICGGGLIVKDYPTWDSINVAEEWATWARDIMRTNAYMDIKECV